MDAFPLTGHCFETLLAWLPQHFLCSFQLGFFSEIPCSRALGFFILPLPAAHTLMTMSWAVTAWPPVGWEACALLRSSRSARLPLTAPGASLVPPRLSKWSFPASLVPPQGGRKGSSTLLLPLPAAHMLMTMSWAVTAWPPVGVWEACALLRSSPLTGHCFETLLAHLPRHFSVLIPVRSFP